MSRDAAPYHRELIPLTQKPLAVTDKVPGKSSLLNDEMWPKRLIGRSLVWAFVGDGVAHRWRIEEAALGKSGFRFAAWGERVWAEVGRKPEDLTQQELLVVLASAISREFAYPGPPEPGVEREVELRRDDFEEARVVKP